jgi:N-acyl-D-aspartate/D-glutamate deacylase
MKAGREPRDFDHEVDATGMWVLPGFIDTHVHGSSSDKAPDLGYSYKLWLAHGVTTVRGVNLAPWNVSTVEKARSAATRSWRRASSTISGSVRAGAAGPF